MLVMAGQSAMGADVGGPSYTTTPTLFYYWTGPYLGGHGGWGWTSTHGVSAEGIFGGGQIGFNYQMSRYFAVGVEGDGAFANIEQKTGGTPFSLPVTFKDDGLGSVRARFGYVASPNMLFYGTAGGGWGHGRISGSAFGLPSGQAWHTGWSAGGGVEYAFMPMWSVKLEYLHYGLGGATYSGVLNTGNIDIETFKVGVNYLFH
jgi:outer membrane immunogenic protein